MVGTGIAYLFEPLYLQSAVFLHAPDLTFMTACREIGHLAERSGPPNICTGFSAKNGGWQEPTGRLSLVHSLVCSKQNMNRLYVARLAYLYKKIVKFVWATFNISP